MSIALIAILLGSIVSTYGRHFLGGTVTWRLKNASATGSPVDIVITQTYSWTYSVVECTDDMIANHELIPLNETYPALVTRTLDCINNCASNGNYVAPLIIPYCIDASKVVGTTVGQRLDTVSIENGSDFTVSFNDSSWRVLAQSTSGAWSIAARINIVPRPGTGLYNNPPVSTMMSPIDIVQNQLTVINIPIADADEDDLRCRWSIASSGIDECGGACPPASLPANTTIYPNCTILITGTVVDAWYAVTLMVEDFLSSSSMTPLSATLVQFLVHVIAPPSCTNLPRIIGIPVEQSCQPIRVGQAFTSVLYAENYCSPNVTIEDISTLSFEGFIKGNITMLNETIYYKNLSWTPTNDQLGYQVVCAMASDSQNSQSSQYCFKFFVSEIDLCVCPGEQCKTTTTTTSTSTQSTSTTVITSTSSSASTSTSTTLVTSAQLTQTSSVNWLLIGIILGSLLLGVCLLLCIIQFVYFLSRKSKSNEDVENRTTSSFPIALETNSNHHRNRKTTVGNSIFSNFSGPCRNNTVYSVLHENSPSTHLCLSKISNRTMTNSQVTQTVPHTAMVEHDANSVFSVQNTSCSEDSMGNIWIRRLQRIPEASRNVVNLPIESSDDADEIHRVISHLLAVKPKHTPVRVSRIKSQIKQFRRINSSMNQNSSSRESSPDSSHRTASIHPTFQIRPPINTNTKTRRLNTNHNEF